MVGRELSAVFPKREVELGDDGAWSCAASVAATTGVNNVNLSVRAGEIVGLAGLVGAGRTELARAIFGLTPADRGEIVLRGEPIKIDSPARAIEHGIAYVPEDRRRHGVVLELPISANITLASLGQLARLRRAGLQARERGRRRLHAAARRQDARDLYARVRRSPAAISRRSRSSRWLVTKPSVLILDEPTQGIDVGAKSEIHALMTDLAAQGVAILMISSELPEIFGMSDRIAVMYGGTIVGLLDRAEATQPTCARARIGPRRKRIEHAGTDANCVSINVRH